ncbi:unnamed protein product [Tilletia controversa]|nr:hypothetical protein CF328_g7962 [Tilletia controversa]CAD6932832.1 unnamed protein product [Tilletia controversa]CAD6948968.1 unnamed protein product [Tilletia controversa]CAD6950758.1 unnamed protein product [Tilletia controversa]CAD6972437.1 unnamed protein product [Tilletia controversa]
MLPRSIAALLPLLVLASALPLQGMRLQGMSLPAGDGSDKVDNAPPFQLPTLGGGDDKPKSDAPPFQLPALGEVIDELKHALPAPKLPPVAPSPIGKGVHAPPTSGLPPIGAGSDKPKHALVPKLPPVVPSPIGKGVHAPPTSGLLPIGEGAGKLKHVPAPGKLPHHGHKPSFPVPVKGDNPAGGPSPLPVPKHDGGAKPLPVPAPTNIEGNVSP